jgi:hypothetical protein
MYEIITLGIVATGLLMMLGVLKSKAAINILFVIILCGILLPFAASLGKGLDSWLLLVFGVIFALLLLQGFAALIFGRRAADSAVGSLIANLLLAPFRVLIGIFRTLFFRRNI